VNRGIVQLNFIRIELEIFLTHKGRLWFNYHTSSEQADTILNVRIFHMIGFKMDKRLNKYLVRKYIKYLNDTIESLYSKHDLTKEEIELFMREFNGFKEKVNQESQIHHSFKEKINSIKFEIKRNPRKSKIRFILEKVFFFLNFSSLSMGILYDDIN
jgi:folate-binding Fe-S cluster repair protein YgfZ